MSDTILHDPQPVWTTETALDFIRPLDEKVRKAGFFLGLTGSVLSKGSSTKDVDITIMPLRDGLTTKETARAALILFGLTQVRDAAEVKRYQQRNNQRCVEVWQTEDGRRVDVFFLELV